jgi:CelD/BcsL family acetyltransferase involved in cellulose biosynthesis
MGSTQEGGMMEGLAPQTGSEISSQLPARKEATATWSKRKKERRVRRDEEDPACTE